MTCIIYVSTDDRTRGPVLSREFEHPWSLWRACDLGHHVFVVINMSLGTSTYHSVKPVFVMFNKMIITITGLHLQQALEKFSILYGPYYIIKWSVYYENTWKWENRQELFISENGFLQAIFSQQPMTFRLFSYSQYKRQMSAYWNTGSTHRYRWSNSALQRREYTIRVRKSLFSSQRYRVYFNIGSKMDFWWTPIV